MTSNPNASAYPSYAIRRPYDFSDGGGTITMANDGVGSVGTFTSTSAHMIWGRKKGTDGNALLDMETFFLNSLNAEIAAAEGTGLTGENEVYVNSDGRLVVQRNATPNTTDIEIYFDSAGADIGCNTFGVATGEYVTIGAGDTEWVSDFQVGNQWIPKMFWERDTGDYPVFRASQSKSMSERFSFLVWGDTYYKRDIRWNAVPAAVIFQERAALQQFADYALITVNDPNAALNVLTWQILIEAPPKPKQIRLFTEVESGTGSDEGYYEIDLQKSKALIGVQPDDMREDSALEIYNVEFYLRKIS